jgi:2-polyprenyl-6-methoxyphenol hydroxylase-like FAD-dependent oxidoreductase
VCNPFGGLGLTGGLVDVGGLYDCLYGVYTEQASPSILTKYSEIRRQKYLEIVDPLSSANIRRLFDQDPETAHENDEFFKLCRAAATN